MLAACVVLVNMSMTNTEQEEEEAPPQMKLPSPPADYALPPELRNPFILGAPQPTPTFGMEAKAAEPAAGKPSAKNSRTGKKTGGKKSGAKTAETMISTAALPAIPAGTELPPPPKELTVNIEGIFWDPASPVVSINGRLMTPGSSVNGIDVIKILPNKVILRVNGNLVEKGM